jgi:phosphopantetheinyl transferase (holo-ACP synthase)
MAKCIGFDKIRLMTQRYVWHLKASELENNKGGREASREALKLCLQDFNLDPNELEISLHHYMKAFPNYCVSISHTKYYGACILAHRDQVESIGIDIEFSERKIPNGSEDRFMNESDLKTWTPKELWVIKEAVYKAIYPLLEKFNFEKTLVLKDIVIHEDKFSLGQHLNLGSFEFFQKDKFDIGIALLNP